MVGSVASADVATPLYLSDPAADYSHVPTLDGLRAIAIMAVLIHHLWVPAVPGGYGVFLFFIISGFLITRLLFADIKQNCVSISGFYMRRLFRLYPVICCYISVCVLIIYCRFGDFDIIEVSSVLVYFVNYLVVCREFNGIEWQFPEFKVFWSLSVEEHYYIVFPFIFVWLRTAARIAVLSISLIVACAVARYAGASSDPQLVGSHYFGMLTQYRVDSIAFGVLLAAACEMSAAKRFLRMADRYWVIALAAAVFTAGFILLRDPALKVALRWPLMGFPIIVFISALIFSERYRLIVSLLNSSIFVWVGRLSYSLYVWHMLAAYIVFDMYPTAVSPLTGMFLSFLFAAVSYSLIERPMIRIGKRVRSERKRAALNASA